MNIIKEYVKKTENVSDIAINPTYTKYPPISNQKYFNEIIEITTQEEINMFNLLKGCYGNIGYKIQINQRIKYLNSFKKSLASAGKIYPNNIYILTAENEIVYYDHQKNQLRARSKHVKLTPNYSLIITGDIHKGYLKYNLYNYKLVTLDSGLLLGSIIDNLNDTNSVILNLKFNYEEITELLPSQNEIPYFCLDINNDNILKWSNSLPIANTDYYIGKNESEVNYMKNIHYLTFENDVSSYDITDFSNVNTLMDKNILSKRKSFINYKNNGFIETDKIINLLYKISKIFVENELYKNIKLIVFINDEKISSKDIDFKNINMNVYTKEHGNEFNRLYNNRKLAKVNFLEIFVTYNDSEGKNYRQEMMLSSSLLYYITILTTLEGYCGCPISNYNISLISNYIRKKYNNTIAISYLITPKNEHSSTNLNEIFYRI